MQIGVFIKTGKLVFPKYLNDFKRHCIDLEKSFSKKLTFCLVP